MYQNEAPPQKTMPIMYDLPSEGDNEEELNSTIHPRPPWETLPTMYDLPSENPTVRSSLKLKNFIYSTFWFYEVHHGGQDAHPTRVLLL
ncbi:MAG: hypothetical protein ACKPCQ_19635, partial [Dolichospermum sp.]